MIVRLMEKFGLVEVILRKIITMTGPMKRKIRKIIKGKKSSSFLTEKNYELINKVINVLKNEKTQENDIIIIHSSLDGLKSLGISSNEIIDMLINIYRDSTLVFTTFPVEPNKKKNIYKYNPQKTMCGTGILPNEFLKRKGVIRTSFPFNSLSAIGKEAKVMMNLDNFSMYPHDENSAWEYCRKRHAKILFLGTTSRESNTMAIHMVPDIMKTNWPIKDWYEERKYMITVDDKISERIIKVQRDFWYQYVNEYKTDRILKEARYIKDISVENIRIEIVEDSYEMINYLVKRCYDGNLMYSIPHKYYK